MAVTDLTPLSMQPAAYPDRLAKRRKARSLLPNGKPPRVTSFVMSTGVSVAFVNDKDPLGQVRAALARTHTHTHTHTHIG
jgi:hypothetical protein